MEVGKKVVCVDDVFSATIRQLYRELPVKGGVYTVRETSLGRDKFVHLEKGVFKPGEASESVTVRILLHELHNDIDFTHKHGQELGFNAERFRELEEAVWEAWETQVAEVIGAG